MDSNTPHPQALHALNRHRKLLRIVYPAAEEAAELSRLFFDEVSDRPLDNSLYSHLFRFHIFERTSPREMQMVHGYTLSLLPLTGLEFQRLGDRIRLWRATRDGRLPPIGDSPGRQDFCSQPQMPLFSDMEMRALTADPGKLVLLWEVDSHLSLSRLQLVCPLGWTDIWSPGEVHWSIDVPHPANWIEPFQDDAASDHDIDLGSTGAGGSDPEDEG
jgi:hypothetical protein